MLVAILSQQNPLYLEPFYSISNLDDSRESYFCYYHVSMKLITFICSKQCGTSIFYNVEQQNILSSYGLKAVTFHCMLFTQNIMIA